MSPHVEETTEVLLAEFAPDQAREEDVSIAGRLDHWLRGHLNFVALAVLAAGLVYRVYIAGRNYLNPDEALHYLLIHQSSVWLAYKAGLTNAHPPLIFFILYYTHLLGRSELMLRMPSVIAGTAFCWLMFRWLTKVLGAAAGLDGLVLLTFSPALVALSAEVRAYSVMLFCVAGALYFLATAFEKESVGRMWCFSIFLWLAIFSHYSVLFFALAIGVYVLARILDSQLPRSVVAAWVMGQVFAVAEYGFLYVTHISKIRKAIPVWSFEFFATYYDWSDGNILKYTWSKTLSVFEYLFAQRYLSIALLLIYLACLALIVTKDILGHQKNTPLNRLGLLLLLPFVSIWGAALARIYPYVGSRHTVVLAPFAVAGVSFVLSKSTQQRLWAGLLLAGLVVLLSNSAINGRGLDPLIQGRNHAQMAQAVDYMRNSIPRGDHILTDYQSALPAAYYFCGPDQIIPIETFQGRFFEFTCHEDPVVSILGWKLTAPVFEFKFQEMARSHNLKPGDRVWTYQTGWEQNLDVSLPAHDSRFRCMQPKIFGENTTIIPFVVGPDLRPAFTPGPCSNTTN